MNSARIPLSYPIEHDGLPIKEIALRRPTVGDHLAARDLIAEIGAFAPAPLVPPAQSIDWIETISQAARSIAGHGEMIALTDELLRIRLARAIADDPHLEAARPIAARLDETGRGMRQIAALGRCVLEKWS